MKMKRIILISVILLTLFSVYFFLSNNSSVKNEDSGVIINSREFSVEIADTSEKRSKGLGGRDNLCETCGMLFIFPEAGNYSFWMKDMKFPLDIIWISKGKIAYIARNIPVDFKEIVNPSISTDKVLEINAGLSDKYGISINDDVKFNSR